MRALGSAIEASSAAAVIKVGICFCDGFRMPATEAVANARPDGYTLLLVAANNAISTTLYDKLNFNFIRDIAPVASIARAPNVLEVNLSIPAKTVPEFIAYAKANPGRINFASSGVGSSIHLSGELFKMMTRVDMLHVPYRGSGPALTDLIGGQVQASDHGGAPGGAAGYRLRSLPSSTKR